MFNSFSNYHLSPTVILINTGLIISSNKILGRTLSKRAHISLLYYHDPKTLTLSVEGGYTFLAVIASGNAHWITPRERTYKIVIQVFWWILARYVVNILTQSFVCCSWSKFGPSWAKLCCSLHTKLPLKLSRFSMTKPWFLQVCSCAFEQNSNCLTEMIYYQVSLPHWVKQDLPCMTQTPKDNLIV